MTYYSRADWGARPPKKSPSAWPSGQPTSWTLHYADGNIPTNRVQSYYAQTVRAIQNYHMDVSSENYNDIAYNFLVDPLGNVYEGRGWNARSGAQASVGNVSSIAACYVGGPPTPLTDAAKGGYLWLINQKPMHVYPHSHWIATSCPGVWIRDWIDSGLLGPQSAAPAPRYSAAYLAAIAQVLNNRKRFPMWLIRDSRNGAIYAFNGVSARHLDGVTLQIQKDLMAQLGLPNVVSDGQNYLIDRLAEQGVLK